MMHRRSAPEQTHSAASRPSAARRFFTNRTRRSAPFRLPGQSLLLLLALLLAARPALAQFPDLLAIRAAASAIEAKNRELARRGGALYEQRALAALRASCAKRGVTRLDGIEPAHLVSDAKSAGAAPLLELEVRRDEDATPLPPGQLPSALELVPALSRSERSSEALAVADGVELRSGQLRTTQSFALARSEVGMIELDLATSAPGQLLLGWSEDASAPRLRRNNARLELVGDGRMHRYAIDAASTLARGLAAGASVKRFFFSSRSTAPIVIGGFRVMARGERYSAATTGRSQELRGGELRSVLYFHVPSTLAFDVEVPRDSPVFESGLALVGEDAAVELELAIEVAGTRTVLLKRLVEQQPRWDDQAIDLGAWAGKRVRLTLAGRGSRGAVALWSSPIVRPRHGDDRTEPFLLLLEDALRPDRLSLYGGPVPSPAHERIAAGGVVFERAFAQATQTRSSVPSLMTSLLPSTNGTWDFSDALSDRFVTLAEALRACGFATASFVQNGNAGFYAGLAQGFDVVFDEEASGAKPASLLGAGSPLLRWIDAQRGRPYFAYVHLLDPHGPYDPAARPDLAAATAGAELQRDRSIDAEWLAKPTAEARRLLYDAEIAESDREIAGFLDQLDKRGDLSRATLAVVADHGEFLGEHGGLWRHHPPGHVEVTRVPLLLRAPKAKASRISESVGLLDVMPTFLDLAGVDASPLVLHGRSLRGVLDGAALEPRAVPGDEMLLEDGARRSEACGSFVTKDALWLRSCTRDEDFTPGRLLATRSGGATPLRKFDLSQLPQNRELELGSIERSFAEATVAAALESMQSSGIEAWRTMTDAASARIVSEPATSERLRALGYAQ